MKIAEVIRGAKRVAISGHVKPDGDSIGSSLGLYNYIKEQYPEIECHVFLEDIPPVFSFLKHSENIETPDQAKNYNFDVYFCLDCGDGNRLGDAYDAFMAAREKVCIDHHISNKGFADQNLIVPSASSTCELLFGTMEQDKISKTVAECLYVGIVHDTGVFQYSSTSSRTMEIAGFLMDCGITYDEIINDTYYARTYVQNRVLGYALLNSKLYLEKQVIFSALSLEVLENMGGNSNDLEGIVSELRNTKGVAVAIFIHEIRDGVFKASLRSNGRVNVSKICVKYGGGGHVRASGVTLTGDETKVRQLLLKEIKKQLRGEDD